MSLSQLFIIVAVVVFLLGGFEVIEFKNAMLFGSASFALGHLALPAIGR